VVDLAGGYSRWLTAFEEISQSWTAAEKAAVCRETARRVYRLGGVDS